MYSIRVQKSPSFLRGRNWPIQNVCFMDKIIHENANVASIYYYSFSLPLFPRNVPLSTPYVRELGPKPPVRRRRPLKRRTAWSNPRTPREHASGFVWNVPQLQSVEHQLRHKHNWEDHRTGQSNKDGFSVPYQVSSGTNHLQRNPFVCPPHHSPRCGSDDQEEDAIWLCSRSGELSPEMLVYFRDFYYAGDIDGFRNMVRSKLTKRKKWQQFACMCYEQKLARARSQLHAFVRSCKWFFVLSWSLTFPDF